MNPKKLKTIRKSKKSKKLSKKSRKTKKSKKPKTARKQKKINLKTNCNKDEENLLMELIKSTKIHGYKQDGGGVADFLKDFMNNKVVSQFNNKKPEKSNKINLRVSNKYNVKQLQERLDSAITKYRQQKEQRELQSSQDEQQNKIDGGEYQISNDVQVGGIQNTEIREVVQDQNIHTFDSNEIDTNYSVMYGGEDERDIKEISISGGSTKHQKWMKEVGQVKEEKNLGFYQALKEASRLRKEKKDEILQQGGEIINKNEKEVINI